MYGLAVYDLDAEMRKGGLCETPQLFVQPYGQDKLPVNCDP